MSDFFLFDNNLLESSGEKPKEAVPSEPEKKEPVVYEASIPNSILEQGIDMLHSNDRLESILPTKRYNYESEFYHSSDSDSDIQSIHSSTSENSKEDNSVSSPNEELVIDLTNNSDSDLTPRVRPEELNEESKSYTPIIEEYEISPREEDHVEREILVLSDEDSHETVPPSELTSKEEAERPPNKPETTTVSNDILDPNSNYDPMDISMCEDYFSRSTSSLICYICKKPGHKASECLEGDAGKSCFLCGRKGHESRHCPFRICNKCHKMGHNSDKCSETVNFSSCYLCGSKLHTMKNCPLTISNTVQDANQIHCVYCHQLGHSNCAKPMIKHSNKHHHYGICAKCAGTDHHTSDCSKYKTLNVNKSTQCFFCGESGHIRANCPFAKQQEIYDKNHSSKKHIERSITKKKRSHKDNEIPPSYYPNLKKKRAQRRH